MREYIQVYTTTDKDNADLIADILVSKRLAACVQIVGPIKSTFRFKDKVEKAEEYLCIIKTDRTLFDSVKEAIKEIHSYEIPEIMATTVELLSKDCSSWLNDSLQ